jgi:apolipoprotein N-acyltransferase
VIDSLLARRLNGLALTLVFPTAWVAKEFFMSFGPFGSWGSAAYTQYGNLPLLQILSVTGLWSITFLIGWFAAACNWVWQAGLESKSARRGAWLCLGTIAGVILLGGARMSLFPPSSETVRAASISKRQVASPSPALRAAVQRVLSGAATSDDMNAFDGWAAANNDDLLSRAEREMQAGARIVFWGEGNAIVTKENEAVFVARGADLAGKYHVYFGMAVVVWNTGRSHPYDNKLILIQPDGHVAWEYTKTHPVPGAEASMEQPGDGKLRDLETPYGRLSSVICFDADFPPLLAQAGALGTDVVLDPSDEWPAIDPIHTQMASFGAIEQGFNLIKQTSQGLSAAFDYQGRWLAATDHYHTSDYAMISEVPTRGVRTIYSRFGDWFAWLSIVGLFLLTAVSFQRRHA